VRYFFLDTNVVFDYLARREPFGPAAAVLFEAAFQGKATLYVSSLSFSHVFYTTLSWWGQRRRARCYRS
jgi:predicted nucleic acid-binding protein